MQALTAYTADTPTAAAATPRRAEAGAMPALYRAAIGPLRTDRYLAFFEREDDTGRRLAGWNWAAALCTLNWMVFRQLWGAALVYVAALEGMALVLFAVGHQALGLPMPVLAGLGLAWLFAASVVPGLYGDAIVHAEVRKKITRALSEAPTLAQARQRLERQAPTRRRLALFLAANAALAAAVAVLWLLLPDGGRTALDRWHAAAATAPDAAPAVASGTVAGLATSTAASTAPSPAESAPAAPSPLLQASAPASTPIATEATASAPTAAQPATADSAVPGPAAAASTAVTAASAPAPADMQAPAQATASAPAAAPDRAPAPASLSAPASRARAAGAVTAATAPAPAPAPAASAAAASAPAAPLPAAPVASGPASQPAAAASPVAAAPRRRTASAHHRRPSAAAQATPAATPAPVLTAAAALPPLPEGGAAERQLFINVGLFADPANARRAHARLLANGLPSSTAQVTQRGTGRPLTRVRVGPFTATSDANAAVATIRAMELEAAAALQ